MTSWVFLLCISFNLMLCVSADNDVDRLMEDPSMFQGDIDLREDQKVAFSLAEAGYSNAFAMVINRKWPNPKSIPYDIASSIGSDPRAQSSIRAAIQEIEQKTCLRFRKRNSRDREYLYFDDGTGCFSPVGYTKGQYNRIQLKSPCRTKGIVVHEMLHSLGFWHEQNRPDRNSYIYVDYSNIDPYWHYAFNIQQNIDSKGSPYDFDSIMHYGSTAFAKDYSKNTITTRDRRYQSRIGQRKGLSTQDVYQLKVRYC